MAEYCPFCMRPSKGKYCQHCGGEIAFRGKELQLPVGTHLMGSQASYLLGASIGQGGFGVTYAALNCASGERVAIKEYFPIYWSERSDNGRDILPKSAYTRTYLSGREKFLKEAMMIRELRHLKTIVKVKDFFLANNTAYIVMEYLEGKTLKQLVKSKGRLTVEELWAVLRPLMEDINDMHVLDVLHRDIAPDNIMMMEDGGLRLMDFGSARSFQKTPAGKTMFVKPGFSPVEQYRPENCQGPFTDVYSMAATIYYCLSGVTPAQATDRLTEVITNHQADPLKRLGELGVNLPASVDTAIQRAMAIRSSARTQTMQEFCDQFYRDADGRAELTFLPLHSIPEERTLEISWRGKRPAGTSYLLFRRINDGKYHLISNGNQTLQRDRLPLIAKRVQYRLELQNAAGVTFGSCESRPIDVSGWAGEPSPPPQQQQTLMIVLAAAAVILLAALVAALAGAF